MSVVIKPSMSTNSFGGSYEDAGYQKSDLAKVKTTSSPHRPKTLTLFRL